jgi:hypothetical protein
MTSHAILIAEIADLREKLASKDRDLGAMRTTLDGCRDLLVEVSRIDCGEVTDGGRCGRCTTCMAGNGARFWLEQLRSLPPAPDIRWAVEALEKHCSSKCPQPGDCAGCLIDEALHLLRPSDKEGKV